MPRYFGHSKPMQGTKTHTNISIPITKVTTTDHYYKFHIYKNI